MQSALTKVPGVSNVNVSLEEAVVKVEHGKVHAAALNSAVEEAGFGATPSR